MNTGTVLLAVIYLRVSTEEQATKGYSLPEQREACRLKAEALAVEQQRVTGRNAELRLVEFLDDFGGDIAERPVLEQMRAFVRTHRPAWVICMDPDRFSRSLKLQLIVADDIEAQNTRLAFVQQDYDPGDFMSKAFFQFRGLMSELDKAKILERTMRGKRGKIKAGRRPNGAAPFGYTHRKETDDLLVCEAEARWVRQIFTWAAEEHLGVCAITRRLNELGVPTKRRGTRWYRSVVRDLLQNTTYYGEMRCNRKDFRGLASVRRLPPGRRQPLSARVRPRDEWVTVPVPVLVPKEQWLQAQANLLPRAGRGGRRDTGLLSMLVRCGECGGAMSYARHGGTRHYLRCQRRYPQTYDYRADTPRCRNRHHRAAAVEEQVWSALVEWLTDPVLLQAYLAEQQRAPARDAVAARLEQAERILQERLAAEYRTQVVTVRRQALGQLAEPAAAQILTESNRVVGQIQQELSAITRRRKALRTENACMEPAAAGPIEAEVAATRLQLDTLPREWRRDLAVRIIDRVTVFADGRATVTVRDR